MPGNLLFADSSFPVIGDGENTRESLKKVENYLYLLLENLRYTLQNLDPGNFNDTEMSAYFEKLTADLVVAQTVISQTIITNELYAQYGAVADLTVDKLRTDYKKAQNYLSGSTASIDYIDIHDEEISFLTAVTDGSRTEQLTVAGKVFWWTDATKTQMTSEKNTGIPVTVYAYSELTKAQFKFRPIMSAGGSETVMPVLRFGAGTGVGDNGVASIAKHLDGFDLSYQTQDGSAVAAVRMRDDGFVDVTARRADVKVNTAAHTITMTPEGQNQNDIVIAYTEVGNKLSLTWPDGKTFAVEVV